MTSATVIATTAAGRGPAGVRVLRASPWFEWAMIGLSAAIAGGAEVDAWAHGHLASTLETVFTPWHALLYSALAATTAFLVLCAWSAGARHPLQWFRALPDGYGLSLVGCFLFGIGGVLDLTWHIVYGIERSFQALISPTHLILMVSASLIAGGALRAAWSRPGRAIGWTGILSATLVLTSFTFFGQFDHPFTDQWAALPPPPVPAQAAEELGMLGFIVQSAFLMGVVLMLVRRFDLPPRSLTVLMTVNAAFVVMIRGLDPIILIGLIGGVAADVLLVLLRPSPSRVTQFRVFAFLVPLVLYAVYFYGIISVDGVWWPVHLWAGAPVVAGLTGLLVSLAVVPPPTPEAATLPA
jgi:hypothetical protein